MKIKLIAIVSGLMIAGGSALADKGWVSVGSVKSGETKTLEVNQPISRVAVTCTQGQIEYKSLVVVTADKKVPYKPDARLTSGQTQPLIVGDGIACRQLIVEISGQGACEVKVRP